ncbi:hypothetical protein FCM35_KLT22171 [Carex littledalei]|uniref:Uncharacterized protein n=1 Tax=Carex littledalei TaxID=544730 RepID=A0A833QH10_9POAL|nr:hypothetical protein FCM35_KLT22171 [Carex littledalei]
MNLGDLGFFFISPNIHFGAFLNFHFPPQNSDSLLITRVLRRGEIWACGAGQLTRCGADEHSLHILTRCWSVDEVRGVRGWSVDAFEAIEDHARNRLLYVLSLPAANLERPNVDLTGRHWYKRSILIAIKRFNFIVSCQQLRLNPAKSALLSPKISNCLVSLRLRLAATSLSTSALLSLPRLRLAVSPSPNLPRLAQPGSGFPLQRKPYLAPQFLVMLAALRRPRGEARK